MLKIKETMFKEFEANSAEYGFELNDEGNAYIRKYHQDEDYPNDYLELQVWLNNREVTIETSNHRYSGFATDGQELEVVYELILNGFIEKCK